MKNKEVHCRLRSRTIDPPCMKTILTIFLLFLGSDLIAQGTFDPVLADQYKADEYGMKTYVMAFLKKGPDADKFSSEERSEIQKGHMANIQKLSASGKLILAGPFIDGQDLRGIFLFDVPTIEEATELTATDPAIMAGVLTMELKAWYGSAALMAIPEIHPKIQEKYF